MEGVGKGVEGIGDTVMDEAVIVLRIGLVSGA